ncbi:carbohydrate binding family 9 domain-containing protein, partial [Candidatus Neomarinimicrobiota bacterium]
MKNTFFIIALILPVVFTFADTDIDSNREKPSIQVVRLNDDHLKIDGLLDEPVWHSAPTGTNFISRSPLDGVEPSFNTTFKILYDNEYLYVGIRAYDNEPDQIIGNLTRKDEYTISDWLYVSIDSFNDNRTAFEFGLNAAGVQHDLVRSDDVESDDTWDGVW